MQPRLLFFPTPLILALLTPSLSPCFGCGSAPPRTEHESAAHRASTTQVGRTASADPKSSTDAAARAPEGDEPKPVPVPIAGTELVRGKATVNVKAPMDKVRESVLDFPHYAEFMPHYKSAKILGRTDTGARDVYMEIEALYGAMRMWVEVELPKPSLIDGVETHETKFIKGNVKDFKAIWRLKKIDEHNTELSLEVFLQPNLPMPANLMNDENLGGAVKGVVAMRARAEQAAKAP